MARHRVVYRNHEMNQGESYRLRTIADERLGSKNFYTRSQRFYATMIYDMFLFFFRINSFYRQGHVAPLPLRSLSMHTRYSRRAKCRAQSAIIPFRRLIPPCRTERIPPNELVQLIKREPASSIGGARGARLPLTRASMQARKKRTRTGNRQAGFALLNTQA